MRHRDHVIQMMRTDRNVSLEAVNDALLSWAMVMLFAKTVASQMNLRVKGKTGVERDMKYGPGWYKNQSVAFMFSGLRQLETNHSPTNQIEEGAAFRGNRGKLHMPESAELSPALACTNRRWSSSGTGFPPTFLWSSAVRALFCDKIAV
jgi:hypothetical protein